MQQTSKKYEHIIRWFRDRGHGGTEQSLNYFFKACRQVLKEWSAVRPLRVVVNANGVRYGPGQIDKIFPESGRTPYTMRVEFGLVPEAERAYAICLSGTQAGYGGTGPHGSISILRFLGVPEPLAKKVLSEKRLVLVMENEGWREVIG